MIQIIGNRLSQWDVGRLVEVTGEASHVHFANQGDSKAVIIDIEEGKAKIPDYLLQTGKTLLAYAVLNGVTLESYTFAVRKRERPENYVYEEDRRNYIYELIRNAESAIARAGQTADEADRAAREADIAADEAREAYNEAKEAAKNANAAADNANKAATNAVHQATVEYMNIRVDLNTPINDGTEVVFRSPVDCSQVTGLIVYYQDGGNTLSKEFAFADAHGNNVGDIDHLFAENVVVKVILDVTTGMAFVQNADTNAYLEGRFKSIEDMIGCGGEAKPLIVNFLDEGTADNAASEIYQYVQNGGFVYLLENDRYIPIADATADCATFEWYDAKDNVKITIKIYDDNSVERLSESGGGSTGGAVLYTPQTLTEEQKEQARANIGVDASGVSLDSTLTQHGVAADAGAIGDLIHAELSYSVTDSVTANTDYKGYYNGKKVNVFIPANTDFDIVVETEAFAVSDLYECREGLTDSRIIADFPSNTTQTLNRSHDCIGFTIWAKAANVTQTGDFTIKVTLKNKDGIEYRLNKVEMGIPGNDILKLNPQNEMLPLFQHAKGSTEEGGSYGKNRLKCLVLAHFSDIHADGENLSRIVRFTDVYKDYIDDVVCTGDMARDNAIKNGVEEDFSWWASNGGENVLMTIGNHETNVVVGTTSNWRDFGKVNTYNKYFAPFIANWGVNQPADAAANGKCYYYKDYPAYNIRVIALDCMYYDADHDTWFVDVLADARTKGYAVITMAHALGTGGEEIECTYSAINTTAGPAILDSGEYTFCANVHSRIDDFITAGGTFICFLGGHYHRDLFGLVQGTEHKQLYSLAACAGSYAPGRDFDGTLGTRSQDCFNIVAIDPALKLVKLFKVGCQYDNYMRKKGTLCYNYETHKLVYNRSCNAAVSQNVLGDIASALDEIREYAQGLIEGGGTE